MITDNKLKFWIENGQNVLFVGKHGVGKTARVIEAFNEAKLNWLYFSASTLDPWVDFIGIPKEVKDNHGNSYIDLVRPKPFAEDTVEAIFLDEYNRSPKKVRNAVMELIQFKSINGKKFKNLKIIWAAINPEDEEEEGANGGYDVEKLDPAQKDRFHVIVNVPYKPDRSFFVNKYGKAIADSAINWWTSLDKKGKDSVSPRRLDYAIDLYTKKGDMRDVLPSNVNVTKLFRELGSEDIKDTLANLYSTQDVSATKKFLSSRNNIDIMLKTLEENANYRDFFLPLMGEEDLAKIITESKSIYQYVITSGKFDNTIAEIKKTGSKLAKTIANDTLALSYTFSHKLLDSLPSLPMVNKYKLGGKSLYDTLHASLGLMNNTYYRVFAVDVAILNLQPTDDKKTFEMVTNVLQILFNQSIPSTIFNIKHLDRLLGFVIKKVSAFHGKTPDKEFMDFRLKLTPTGQKRLNLFLTKFGSLYA
jgi:hypothetical protein